MTTAERAEYERREAIRAARQEEFFRRAIEAQQRADEKSQRLLRERLKRQPELAFEI